MLCSHFSCNLCYSKLQHKLHIKLPIVTLNYFCTLLSENFQQVLQYSRSFPLRQSYTYEDTVIIVNMTSLFTGRIRLLDIQHFKTSWLRRVQQVTCCKGRGNFIVLLAPGQRFSNHQTWKTRMTCGNEQGMMRPRNKMYFCTSKKEES